MSTFTYDDTALSEQELGYIGAFVVQHGDFSGLAVAMKKALTTCDDCVRKPINKTLIIMNCLKTIPDTLDRVKFIGRQCSADDRDFLIKIVVGYIDLEHFMENAESLVEEEQITEGSYLTFMNCVKHMYAVKKRHWV